MNSCSVPNWPERQLMNFCSALGRPRVPSPNSHPVLTQPWRLIVIFLIMNCQSAQDSPMNQILSCLSVPFPPPESNVEPPVCPVSNKRPYLPHLSSSEPRNCICTTGLSRNLCHCHRPCSTLLLFLTMPLNKSLHMDPHTSCLVGPVTLS